MVPGPGTWDLRGVYGQIVQGGGPLFFKAAGPGHIQVGVTGFPGVYARLSNRSAGSFILEVTGGAPVSSSRAA
jgi:hypothetical protein